MTRLKSKPPSLNPLLFYECQFIFMYENTDRPDEVVWDVNGNLTMPAKSDVLLRNGEMWRVEKVSTHETRTPRGVLPVHRVLLKKPASPTDETRT